MRQRIFWLCAIGLLCAAVEVLWMVSPREATAIPAWARKYGGDCSVCHYPAVPRLNSTGQRFRWAGYRTSNDFGKDPDLTNVGHFLAARGDFRYSYENPEEGPRESEFQWHDTSLFYAGAVTKNFSAFNEIEIEPEEEGTEVELEVQIQGTWGSPERFATVRFGQFHVLQDVGLAGLDRPTSIVGSSIFREPLTSSDIPFRIGANQRGVEAAVVFRNSRLLAQVLNGVDTEGEGDKEEIDPDKDLLIAFEQILDEIASGVTLFGYRGVWHNGVIPDDFRFFRYGVTANKVFPFGFEIMAGYVHSNDDLPSVVGPTIRGDSFFVELEQYFRDPNLTLLARYDWIDPDRDTSGDTRNRQTIGVVKTLERNLRVALEGRRLEDKETDQTDFQAVAQAMLNF